MFIEKLDRPEARDTDGDGFIDQKEITAGLDKFAEALWNNGRGPKFGGEDFDYQLDYNAPKNASNIIPDNKFWNANKDGDMFWMRSELEENLFKESGKIQVIAPGASIDLDIIL